MGPVKRTAPSGRLWFVLAAGLLFGVVGIASLAVATVILLNRGDPGPTAAGPAQVPNPPPAANEPIQAPPAKTDAAAAKPKPPADTPKANQASPANLPAAPPSLTAERPFTGPEIYRHTLRSTAVVVRTSDRSGDGVGSGVVVNDEHRLLVTNHHVVRGGEVIVVMFPAYRDKTDLITDVEHYLKNARSLGIPAKVVASNPSTDLALLQLDTLPAGVRAVPIAAQPAEAGQAVYSIGASGIEDGPRGTSGHFWRLTTGTVRTRSRRQGSYLTRPFDMMVLETQAPVNPGDSGGPVVSEKVELVAVVAHYHRFERLVSGNVDLVEVRDLVSGYSRTAGFRWQDPPLYPLPRVVQADAIQQQLVRLKSPNPADRAVVIGWLGGLGPEGRKYLPDLLAALDPPDPEVERAAEVTLKRIGPPADVDSPAVARALAAKSAVARRYALAAFAGTVQPPKDAVPPLSALLRDPDPTVRRLAAAAIARYGPGARTDAVPDLLRLIGDSDPEVAKAAAGAVEKLGPYGPADASLFEAALTEKSGAVRSAALRELARLPLPPPDVKKRFAPLLADGDPALRVIGVRALASSPETRPALKPHLPALCQDASPDVRVAVAEALSAEGGTNDGKLRLMMLLERDTSPEVIQTAAAAIGKILRPAAEDRDLIRSLLKHGPPAGRIKALTILTVLGAKGETLWPDATPLLKDEARAVRVAALNLVAAMGPAGSALADEVASTVPAKWPAPAARAGERTSEDGTDDEVAVAALAALGRLGPAGVKHVLAFAAREGIPGEARRAVCRGLAGGEGAREAVPLILSWVDTKRDTSDEASTLLAKLGGDRVITELIARTDLTRLGRGATATDIQHPAVRRWALRTLGALDFSKMTAEQKKKVVTHVRHLRASERDGDNKELATAILVRLGESLK